MPDLAVFYEHPSWFGPLFAALDRHGVDWTAIPIQDHTFDPAATRPPAPVILNRLAMSSFLRRPGVRHQQGAPARPVSARRRSDSGHPRRPPPRGRGPAGG
jgi:hypothetical protein